ncbi:MAG TPA: hypothetical protein VNT53_10220 [Pseudolysinimonas sp.]|nr:hypothetical protein [Pseudolysinimonas sp.]
MQNPFLLQNALRAIPPQVNVAVALPDSGRLTPQRRALVAKLSP